MKSKMKTLKLAAFLGAITVATAGFGFANVTALADTNDVAKIEGGQSYATLAEAFSATVDGDTITLLNDITLEAALTIASDKDVTLDLAGYTISYVAQNAGTSAVITNKGDLTIEDSVGNGLITNKALYPDSDWDPEGFPTYANNTIANGGSLVVNGGTIENTTSGSGAYYAIDTTYASRDVSLIVNGGKVVCENNAAIRICTNPATVDFNFAVTGGEIVGTRGVWIHLPHSAPNPVDVNVEVTGGEIKATGYTSGGYFYKQAIYCYSYGNSAEDVNLTVSDGYIEGDIALGGGVKIAPETLTITGGTFDGGVYTYNDNGVDNISVSGGTFNDPYGDVVNYLTDDATVEINGFTYGNIAQVGSATYETLQEAIDNANGAEIKLLGNVIGAGVTIDKKTNIDFNGYTYVVDSGVEVDGVSYGFYIKPANAVSGDKVELKNGEIVIDNTDVDIAVFSECPNEAQLNIKNFDIQANNATALMVSGSEANIEGASKISSNGTAILVNNPNEVNRVQLVVIALENNNPQVNGRILVEGNNIVAQLVNGEFNGSIYSNNADNLRISGGKYSTDVTQYVVAGKTLEQEGMYFLVVEDNNGGNGNDDNQGGNNQNPSQPGGGEPERPDGLTDEQWMAILGVLGALNNSQNNGAQTNDSEVAAPANNTAAVVIAIVASSLVVLIVAAAVVLWILEKKEIFKISKYFKD